MMKRTLKPICLTLCLALGFVINAQIDNGGFEGNTGLPNNTGQYNLVNAWSNAGSTTASPDYYHNNGTAGGDLPETPIALVNAYEGKGVMGFVATGVKGTDYREYLVNQLNQPLQAGAKYVVSFSVTNGERTSFSTSGLGASHFGVAFSSASPQQIDNEPLMLSPQFEKQNPLYDRAWTTISFAFVADADYEFMTVGVFGDDQEKDINVYEGSSPSIAYYFVDDFKITQISQEITQVRDEEKNDPELEVEDEVAVDFYVPNSFTPNDDGDNDIFKPVNVFGRPYTLNIYNRWGEILFQNTGVDVGWDGRKSSGGKFSQDMYIWEIIFEKETEDGTSDEILRGTLNLIK
ncbi:MAG: gliding motility-associated C-terminal domain-containing protein [Bacteroidota bacterium]